MPNWLPDFLQGVIGQLLPSVIGGVVLAYWGKLQERQKWSNPQAAYYGIMTTAALFFLLTQIGWEPSTKFKVRQWLDEVSLGVKDISDETTYFRFQVTDHEKRSFVVTQFRNRFNNLIQYETRINIEAHFPKIKELDRQSQIAIARQLKKDLAVIGVGYAGVTYPLKSILIFKTVPISEIKKADFLEQSGSVLRGAITVAEDVGIALKDDRG